jgi:phosphoesterase RecJ-like protein
MTTTHYDSLHKALLKGQKFLITAHRYPDTDAIGSCLALANYLQQESKDVYIWLDCNYLEDFKFLPFNHLLHADFPSHYKFDTCVVLDCSNLERVNYFHKIQDCTHAFTTINIDHHSDNNHFGDLNITANISSVGELLFHFLSGIGLQFNKETANCLYAAIAFDTGRFAFSNVTAKTLHAAAVLVDYGATPYLLSQAMDENKSLVDFELIKIAIDGLKINKEKRYAYTCTPKSAPKGSIKVIDFIRQLGEDLELFIVFQELKSEKVKVNLRSKHSFDVSTFSQKFGGGGHKHAAGIVMENTLEESVEIICKALEDLCQ